MVRTSSAGPAEQTQHSQIKYMHYDSVTPCWGFLLSWQDYLVLGLSPTLLLVQPCLYWLKFHLCDVKIHSYTIYTDWSEMQFWKRQGVCSFSAYYQSDYFSASQQHLLQPVRTAHCFNFTRLLPPDGCYMLTNIICFPLVTREFGTTLQ